MKRLMCTVLVALAAACGGDDVTKMEFTAKERAEFEQPNSAEDLCDTYNFYGDGECDVWCVAPDPDCGVEPDPDPEPRPDPRPPGEPEPLPEPPPEPDPDPEPDPEPLPIMCPAPDAPNVDYISQDPDRCAAITFACPEGWDYIDQPECGCGCIVPTCESNADCQADERCIDDALCKDGDCVSTCGPQLCGLPNTADCRGFPLCSADEVLAEVNGCFVCVTPDACIDRNSMCNTDSDCPDGYCDRDTFQCAHPNCDDGKPLLCDALRPDCGPDYIGASRDGCWICVDPRTCQSPVVDGGG
jgi:hypothetical protein